MNALTTSFTAERSVFVNLAVRIAFVVTAASMMILVGESVFAHAHAAGTGTNAYQTSAFQSAGFLGRKDFFKKHQHKKADGYRKPTYHHPSAKFSGYHSYGYRKHHKKHGYGAAPHGRKHVYRGHKKQRYHHGAKRKLIKKFLFKLQ